MAGFGELQKESLYLARKIARRSCPCGVRIKLIADLVGFHFETAINSLVDHFAREPIVWSTPSIASLTIYSMCIEHSIGHKA